MQTEEIRVSGMVCGACVNSVKNALKAINGVDSVDISLATGQTSIQYDDRLTSIEKLKSAVKQAGYGLDDTNIN